MSSNTLVARAQALVDRARDLVAGRQLVHEPLAVGVHQQRALAAHRLRDQEAVELARRARERGGMELHELEVGERGAGLVGEQQAGADRAARVGRALPQRGRAAGASTVARAGIAPDSVRTPTQRPSVDPQREGGAALVHLDALVRRDESDRRAVTAAGRAAAGVHDAAARVASLERQLQLAVGERSKGIPARSSSRTRVRRLGAEDPARSVARCRARRSVSCEVQLAGRRRERRREAALGPVARRLRERRARDERDARALPAATSAV